jgi:hypothetical protein
VRGLPGLARLLAALALAALALAGTAVRWSVEAAAPPLRSVAVALAVCAALLALTSFFLPGPAASAAREARVQFAARIATALAALLPFAWAVLNPGRHAGSAGAAGSTALGLLGMVLLSSYLCLHLRASLLRARFWATALLCALVCVVFYRSWGYDLGVQQVFVVVLDVFTAGALVALSGSLPGTRPAAEIPLAELAAFAAFGTPWAWASPEPVGLAGAGAAVLGQALAKFPRFAPLAQAACAGLAVVLVLDGDASGAIAVPLLACALAIGR